MSDLFSPRFSALPPPPPPAPPLPPQRYVNRATNALARFAQPFIGGSRPPSAQAHHHDDLAARNPLNAARSSSPLSSQTATHKTGIPIAAVDLSPQRTHAVLAGREILKTIRVDGATCAEQFNLRAAINTYASTHNTGSRGASSGKHRDDLAANDVKWSHGNYSSTIATAAPNGRIVLYDVNRAGVEIARLHEHHRQVHKLAFNPHQGYYLLSGSQDTSLRLWDLRAMAGGRSVTTFRSSYKYATNSESVRDVKWSPTDGTEFACATDAGFVQRWDFRKGSAPLLRINAHRKPCQTIDWHPDGKHLVSGGMDKMVNVWDFSSLDRRQKPFWSFRAPQAVKNVRWRPAGWHSDAYGPGSWETTHLVTSYNDLDPRVHLWDFRHVTVPFREIDRFNTSPTDMLWHSEDLLWTVGFEGIFTQTDVHFAPKIGDRRNAQAFDCAPDGEISLLTQVKLRRRGSALEQEQEQERDGMANSGEGRAKSGSGNGSGSGERLSGSRMVQDDEAAGQLLGSSFKRRDARSWAAKSPKSVGNTPPSDGSSLPVMKLDEIMSKKVPIDLVQNPARGHLPDSANWAVFAHMANCYRMRVRDSSALSYHEAKADLARVLHHNSSVAREVDMYRLAQSWKILSLALRRDVDSLKHQEDTTTPAAAFRHDGEPQKVIEQDGIDVMSTASKTVSRPMKSGTSLLKPAAQAAAAAAKWPSEGTKIGPTGVHDSSSNVATPLARPVPDSPVAGHLLPGVPATFDGEDASLPPPFLRSVPRNINVEARRTVPALLGDNSSSNQAHFPQHRSDHPRLNPLHDAHRPQGRPPLTLDPPRDTHNSPSPNSHIQRFESQESFPMFSASTDDSSHLKNSLPGSFDSLHHHPDPPNAGAANSWEGDEEDRYLNNGRSYDSSLPAPSGGGGGYQTSSSERIPFPIDRSVPSAGSPDYPHIQVTQLSNLQPNTSHPALNTSHPTLPRMTSTALEAPKPASFVLPAPASPPDALTTTSILTQLLPYHLGTLTDALNPTMLLLLLSPHLPPTTLPPFLSLSIIRTLHMTLLSAKLFVSAAALRNIAHPLHPSLMGSGSGGDDEAFTIGLLCTDCGAKLPSPHAHAHADAVTSTSRCPRCRSVAAACPICHARTPGLRWAWCQGCGHGGHKPCLDEWWAESASEGVCALPGCGHDCAPGEMRRARHQARLRRAKDGVKKDEWVVDESRAVERLRSALGGGGGGGEAARKYKIAASPEQTA
ncbi:MAG: hypothetical protein M1825_002883 [Sarcosagium campestre]|nr:MAG: hypothetical protein M1825_002883 [Sarcosagium campestre]